MSEFRTGNHALVQSDKATNGKVTVKTESKEVVAANEHRVSVTICNDAESSTVYLGLGAAAVAGEGIRLNEKGGAIVITDYLGAIYCIGSAEGKISYTEVG